MARLVILILVLLHMWLATIGQTHRPGVHVTPMDTNAIKLRIDYQAPATTAFGGAMFTDTLFCASSFETMTGVVNIVQAMTRTSDTTFHVVVQRPDSAYAARFEICIPTDRAPNGIATIEISRSDNEPYPLQSFNSMTAAQALTNELRLYPNNLIAYYQACIVENGLHSAAYVDSVRATLRSDTSNAMQRLLTLGLLTGLDPRMQDEARVFLQQAAKAQVSSGTLDPIFRNGRFWSDYARPVFLDGKPKQRTVAFVAMQDVAGRWPKSAFAKTLLERYTLSADIRAEVANSLFSAWDCSNDVDVLRAMASQCMTTESPYYNLTEAYRYLQKAEQSWSLQTGFRNGENIYGSMGRIDHIRLMKLKVLNDSERYNDAVDSGLIYQRSALSTHGRQQLAKELARAARIMGRDALADSVLKMELPPVPNFGYTTLDGHAATLQEHRGKVVVLDFWFLGCAGCALEQRSLNEFAAKYKNNANVVFLSVALNDSTTLQKYKQRFQFNYDVVPNGEGICTTVGISAYPTHIVIARDGSTKHWSVGGSTSSGVELGKTVDELLK